MSTHAETIIALYAANNIPLTRPITAESLSATADELVGCAPLSARALRLYAIGFKADAQGYAPENATRRLHYHEVARELYGLAAEVAGRALATGTPSAAGSAGSEMAEAMDDMLRRL